MPSIAIEQLPDEDSTIIEGTRYSNDFLRILGQEGIDNGPFEITARENGNVILRTVAVPKWNPIETAPNESAVLVAVGGAVGEAFLRGKDGWWWAGNDPSDSWGGQIYPTHWQGLPEAPPQ